VKREECSCYIAVGNWCISPSSASRIFPRLSPLDFVERERNEVVGKRRNEKEIKDKRKEGLE
jgi:hypothetical protein